VLMGHSGTPSGREGDALARLVVAASTRFTEDHMHRTVTLVGLAMLLTIPASPALSQGKNTKAQKITNAMTAAPRSISGKATIMDWPATAGGQMTTLRAGTNAWTCLPDVPMTKGNDPMCMDAEWMSFMNAVMSKSTPNVPRAGVSYMIAPGGAYTSNKVPFAPKATADNDWGFDPPHVMVLVTDKRALEGLPTTRQSGGPWVMWTGTPYAHIMVPLSSTKK
jgi:hypothetical protein